MVTEKGKLLKDKGNATGRTNRKRLYYVSLINYELKCFFCYHGTTESVELIGVKTVGATMYSILNKRLHRMYVREENAYRSRY